MEMDYIRDLLKGAETVTNLLIENNIPEKYAISFTAIVLAHSIVKDPKTLDMIIDLASIYVALYKDKEVEE
jgi:hypothetical protein